MGCACISSATAGHKSSHFLTAICQEKKTFGTTVTALGPGIPVAVSGGRARLLIPRPEDPGIERSEGRVKRETRGRTPGTLDLWPRDPLTTSHEVADWTLPPASQTTKQLNCCPCDACCEEALRCPGNRWSGGLKKRRGRKKDMHSLMILITGCSCHSLVTMASAWHGHLSCRPFLARLPDKRPAKTASGTGNSGAGQKRRTKSDGSAQRNRLSMSEKEKEQKIRRRLSLHCMPSSSLFPE